MAPAGRVLTEPQATHVARATPLFIGLAGFHTRQMGENEMAGRRWYAPWKNRSAHVPTRQPGLTAQRAE
jgi:hypothetical protein